MIGMARYTTLGEHSRESSVGLSMTRYEAPHEIDRVCRTRSSSRMPCASILPGEWIEFVSDEHRARALEMKGRACAEFRLRAWKKLSRTASGYRNVA